MHYYIQYLGLGYGPFKTTEEAEKNAVELKDKNRKDVAVIFEVKRRLKIERKRLIGANYPESIKYI